MSLLIDLDKVVLYVSVDIVYVLGDLGLDVLCAVGISKGVLRLIEVSA